MLPLFYSLLGRNSTSYRGARPQSADKGPQFILHDGNSKWIILPKIFRSQKYNNRVVSVDDSAFA